LPTANPGFSARAGGDFEKPFFCHLKIALQFLFTVPVACAMGFSPVGAEKGEFFIFHPGSSRFSCPYRGKNGVKTRVFHETALIFLRSPSSFFLWFKGKPTSKESLRIRSLLCKSGRPSNTNILTPLAGVHSIHFPYKLEALLILKTSRFR
jgi:hypothetical protein